MDWFKWFENILEALCWGRKHEQPIEIGNDRRPSKEAPITNTYATALDWTAYGAAPYKIRATRLPGYVG